MGDLYTYAMMKVLFDRGERYIDSFWPFAIRAMPTDQYVSLQEIKEALRATHELYMPLHVLTAVLKRAKRKGLIEQEKGSKLLRLTEKGATSVERMEKDRDVERRLNSLSEKLVAFLEAQGSIMEVARAQELILGFIERNRSVVVEFLNPDFEPSTLDFPKLTLEARQFIDFVKKVESSDPESYESLRNVIQGSLISAMLSVRDVDVLADAGSRKFKRCDVFLDTNLVLSILELHAEEYSIPARELHSLLKKFGFDIKVLGTTVDEICRVIRGYRHAFFRYPRTARVDTIYSHLRRKGWKQTDAQEFIIGIEEVLSKEHISVDWTDHVQLPDFDLKHEEMRGTLAQYKPTQPGLGQSHDLYAIEAIENRRDKPHRRIEDCRALFLTSDRWLSKFDFVEMGHKDNGTVCEVVFDQLLTNLLWLKDPSSKIPVVAIISAHSRDLFIRRAVWERFYDTLQQLYRDGAVDDSKVSMLFYHKYIEEVLLELDERDLGRSSPEFVLGKIEHQAAEINKSIKSSEQLEKEFIENLGREKAAAEAGKEDEWLVRISKMKDRLRRRSGTTANTILWIGRSLVMVIFLIIIVPNLLRGEWDVITRFSTIISLLFVIVTLLGGQIDLFGMSVKQKLSEYIYRRKKATIGLDDLTTDDA